MRKLLVLLVALVLTGAVVQAQQVLPQGYIDNSRGFGYYNVPVYNQWKAMVANGNLAAGVVTIQVQYGQYALPDGTYLNPFSVTAPITIGIGANAETVTPAVVSGCNFGAGNPLPSLCSITANFANTHGQGEPVFSGSFGLQEAINDAYLKGGGTVVIDRAFGGTNATVTAAIPYPNVNVMDTRNGQTVYWNAQGGLTSFAAPATLTALTALPSATPVGAFTATNYNVCIAYVDVLGQEGPCSVTFVDAGVATGSFIFSPPAATAGAVGYTIYIGLTGAGNGLLQYKVPLVTQPTVVGVYPATNGVCTLTNIETVTPACAVANATYAQTGATATVSAITVNTSPIQPLATIISTTTVYIPNPGGRTTFVYTPGSRVGTPGIPSFLPFPIGAAAATVVPDVEGTINVPPGFMNYVGRTLEVCGFLNTTATAATIEDIQFQWDSMGQNTAGKGIVIGDLTTTTTFTATGKLGFCADFQTTVASAAVAGGSINPIGGYLVANAASLAATVAGGGESLAGAVGALNLAADARINVIYLHTTATDGAGWTLQSLTAKVIN